MRRIIVPVAAVLFVACDAGTTAPVIGGPYGDVLGAFCDVLDRCPDAFGQPIAYRSRQECQAILGWAMTCRLTETEVGDVSTYGVEQNIPEVDRAAADACIAWLEAATCDSLMGENIVSPCSTLLVAPDDDGGGSSSGSGIEGQSCDGDYDCQAHLRCVGGGADPEAHVTYCRVCVPRLAEGEECTRESERECAEGLYCTYRGSDVPRQCMPLTADGEPCVDADQCVTGWCNTDGAATSGLGECDPGGHEGEPCMISCRPGSFCDAGTCAALRRNGEPCADSSQCANYSCDTAAGVCGQPDGTPCSYGSQCASGGCNGGVCGAPAAGASCSTDTDCRTGELCNWDTFTCVAPQPDGSSCRRDEECASSFCNGDDQCQTRPELGDPCADTYECGPRAYCSGGVCTARLAPGAACEGYEPCLMPFVCMEGRCELINLACEPAHAGQQCAFFMVCDESSYCDLFDNFTCKPKANIGQTCTPSFLRGVEVCVAGSRCVTDSTTGESTCVARAALGEACDGGADACVEGSYCFGGTCMAAPIGQPCDGGAPCPEGLACNDNLEVCVPPGPEGTPCESNEECLEGLFCQYVECVARFAIGESCRDTYECVESAYCNTTSYTCEARLAQGAPCYWYDDACAEGLYCPRGASEPTCIPRLAAGESCSDDVECASGACYSSSWCLASAMCIAP